MSHLFCHSCGSKLSYSHAKPNFCGKCGQQLNMSATANVAGQNSTIEKSVIISQDETDAESVPHVENFQIGYSIDQNPVTLGSLLGTAENTPDTHKKRKSLSVDEFIDEKKKER